MDAKFLLECVLEEKSVPPAVDQINTRNSASVHARIVPLPASEYSESIVDAFELIIGAQSAGLLAENARSIGGMNALGGIAYNVFYDWKLRFDTRQPPSAGIPLTRLPSDQANMRCRIILQAMISAARINRPVDDLKLTRLTQKINALQLGRQITRFLLDEAAKAISLHRMAALVCSGESAAEAYLASALIIDRDSPLQREYLESIALLTGLHPWVTQRLETHLNPHCGN